MVHQALGRTGSHSVRNGVAVIQERQMDVVGFAQQLFSVLSATSTLPLDLLLPGLMVPFLNSHVFANWAITNKMI